MSVAELVPAHREPRFDLQVEAWIPVFDTEGNTLHVSLRDLLLDTGHLVGFASPNGFEQMALRRWLNVLALALIADSPDFDWKSVARGDASLPPDAVERLLKRLGPHTWLYHPKTPFLQDASLRDNVVSNIVSGKKGGETLGHPFATLLPHVPSQNNEAWWFKPGEVTEPDNAAIARALLVRHYGATPGNEMDRLPTKKRSSPGGVMVPGPRDATQVMWDGPTVAASMVTNVLRRDIERCGRDSTFFWEDPARPAVHLNDPLYLLSATAAAVFLIEPEDAEVPTVLRAGLPLAKDVVDALSEQAMLADPYILRAPKKEGAAVEALKDSAGIVFSPEHTQIQHVNEFYRRTTNAASLLPNVLNPRSVQFPAAPGTALTAVTMVTTGPATGLRIDNVTMFTLNADPFLLEPTRAAALRTMLAMLAGPQKSVTTQLRHRVREAVRTHSDSGLGKGLAAKADALLWIQLEEPLHTLLTEVATKPEPPVSLDDETKKVWRDAVSDVFETVLRPYETSANLRAHVIEQHIALRRRTWTLLSPTS